MLRPIRVFLALFAVLMLALCASPVQAGCCGGGGRAGFGLFGHRHRAVYVESYACPVAYPATVIYSQPMTTYQQPVIYSTPGYYQQPAQILGPPLPSFSGAGGCANGMCPVR